MVHATLRLHSSDTIQLNRMLSAGFCGVVWFKQFMRPRPECLLRHGFDTHHDEANVSETAAIATRLPPADGEQCGTVPFFFEPRLCCCSAFSI